MEGLLFEPAPPPPPPPPASPLGGGLESARSAASGSDDGGEGNAHRRSPPVLPDDDGMDDDAEGSSDAERRDGGGGPASVGDDDDRKRGRHRNGNGGVGLLNRLRLRRKKRSAAASSSSSASPAAAPPNDEVDAAADASSSPAKSKEGSGAGNGNRSKRSPRRRRSRSPPVPTLRMRISPTRSGGGSGGGNGGGFPRFRRHPSPAAPPFPSSAANAGLESQGGGTTNDSAAASATAADAVVGGDGPTTEGGRASPPRFDAPQPASPRRAEPSPSSSSSPPTPSVTSSSSSSFSSSSSQPSTPRSDQPHPNLLAVASPSILNTPPASIPAPLVVSARKLGNEVRNRSDRKCKRRTGTGCVVVGVDDDDDEGGGGGRGSSGGAAGGGGGRRNKRRGGRRSVGGGRRASAIDDDDDDEVMEDEKGGGGGGSPSVQKRLREMELSPCSSSASSLLEVLDAHSDDDKENVPVGGSLENVENVDEGSEAKRDHDDGRRISLGILDVPTAPRVTPRDGLDVFHTNAPAPLPPSGPASPASSLSSSSSSEEYYDDYSDDDDTDDDGSDDSSTVVHGTNKLPRPPASASRAERTRYYWELCYGSGSGPPPRTVAFAAGAATTGPSASGGGGGKEGAEEASSATRDGGGGGGGAGAGAWSANRLPPAKSCLSSTKREKAMLPPSGRGVSHSTPTLCDRFAFHDEDKKSSVRFNPSPMASIGVPTRKPQAEASGKSCDAVSTPTGPPDQDDAEEALAGSNRSKMNVKFGSPRAVEFDTDRPTVELTPLPSEVARVRFPVEQKEESPEEVERHEETVRNSSVLAAWEDDFDSYLEEEEEDSDEEDGRTGRDSSSLESVLFSMEEEEEEGKSGGMDWSPEGDRRKRKKRRQSGSLGRDRRSVGRGRRDRNDRRSSSFFSRGGRSLLDDEDDGGDIASKDASFCSSSGSSSLSPEAGVAGGVADGLSSNGPQEIDASVSGSSPEPVPVPSDAYESPTIDGTSTSGSNDNSDSTTILRSVHSSGGAISCGSSITTKTASDRGSFESTTAANAMEGIEEERLEPNVLLDRYDATEADTEGSGLRGEQRRRQRREGIVGEDVDDIVSTLLSDPTKEEELEWDLSTVLRNLAQRRALTLPDRSISSCMDSLSNNTTGVVDNSTETVRKRLVESNRSFLSRALVDADKAIMTGQRRQASSSSFRETFIDAVSEIDSSLKGDLVDSDLKLRMPDGTADIQDAVRGIFRRELMGVISSGDCKGPRDDAKEIDAARNTTISDLAVRSSESVLREWQRHETNLLRALVQRLAGLTGQVDEELVKLGRSEEHGMREVDSLARKSAMIPNGTKMDVLRQRIEEEQRAVNVLEGSVGAEDLRLELASKMNWHEEAQFALEKSASAAVPNCLALCGVAPFRLEALSDESVEISYSHVDGSQTFLIFGGKSRGVVGVLPPQSEEPHVDASGSHAPDELVQNTPTIRRVRNPDSVTPMKKGTGSLSPVCASPSQARGTAAAQLSRGSVASKFRTALLNGTWDNDSKDDGALNVLHQTILRQIRSEQEVENAIQSAVGMLSCADLAILDVSSLEKQYDCQFHDGAVFVLAVRLGLGNGSAVELRFSYDRAEHRCITYSIPSEVQVEAVAGDTPVLAENLRSVATSTLNSNFGGSNAFLLKRICAAVVEESI